MSRAGHIVERWISWSLRLGVWFSAAFMVVGILLTYLESGEMSKPPPTPSETFSSVFSRPVDSLTILVTGLLLLMFTPILRVFTAILGFLAEKDWRFTAVSLAVFLMLVGELVYSLR
ncbi:MAG: DUF1634 domain-containing protein [Ignavibacteriales bacterium]|nr:DUF1634 domain-containing protein [Ignavibacteriales bacterium]